MAGRNHPSFDPLGALAANLSGVTIGTIIMVIGFLKDNRLDQERKGADDAIAEAAVATAKAAAAEVVIQQERERADRYLAELERYRESCERTHRSPHPTPARTQRQSPAQHRLGGIVWSGVQGRKLKGG